MTVFQFILIVLYLGAIAISMAALFIISDMNGGIARKIKELFRKRNA